MMKKTALIVVLLVSLSFVGAHAEDGSNLWLRYTLLNKARVTELNSDGMVVEGKAAAKPSPTLRIAIDELRKYYDSDEAVLQHVNREDLGSEGFAIMGDTVRANTDIGLLYGAYELLSRRVTRGEPNADTDGMRMKWSARRRQREYRSVPFYSLRILNHWDNLDGSIERGYAGRSIFWGIENKSNHNSQFSILNSPLIQYARANASIGINGTVLNNVNASPKMLTKPYLKQVKQYADLLRPYGIRVYLSINFASPMALGDTKTADPLDETVKKWWQRKAREIYRMIPDFGGFLVKANSEGQPGPFDYGRSHADGANMLADALQPYGGIVMWRCFVYGSKHKGEDRVMQAVSEFKPLDGQFRDNVILQTKNGPLDFQPREPYSPIFDQITKTPNMVELQITQEYLGQSRHLVYLAPMWKEFFRYVPLRKLRGVAGVANVGDDANFCGHHFSQANWYAFGRLSWDPRRLSEVIARDWLRLTFSTDSYFVSAMTRMMQESREACVNYMMPLGLHHIFKFDHHMGPEPDGFKAEYPLEWCPVYYHQADSLGVGFDRSSTGTGATAQYRDKYAKKFDSIDTCPEEFLLWFHHVPWSHPMRSGLTLWQELQEKYNDGVHEVDRMVLVWQNMRPYVDNQRWQEVNDRLLFQQKDARLWRDTCLDYFGRFADRRVK